MPFDSPKKIMAATNTLSSSVAPHRKMKGAPHSAPSACTYMRPPRFLARDQSAMVPPSIDPTMLATCKYTVADTPDRVRLSSNFSYKKVGIQLKKISPTEFAPRNARASNSAEG